MLDLHVFVLDPGIFFTTARLIVSDLGFFFLVPCTCFVDLASIRVGGGNSIVICAHIGLDVFGPWHLFFGPAHVFLDLAQGGGNSDIETRCMQEDVERKGEHVDIEAR